MAVESEERVGVRCEVEDLPSMSQSDLDALGRSLQSELVELKKARGRAVDLQRAVHAERVARRQAALAGSYPERRRTAVLSGEAPPDPPAASAAPARTAARRLSGISIPLSRQRDPVPVPKPKSAARDEPVVVSDHAVVRYLERALGIDIEHVRRQILAPSVLDAVRAGLSRIRTPLGVVVVRDGTVTSFLTSGTAGRRSRRGAAGRPDDGWSSQDDGIPDQDAD